MTALFCEQCVKTDHKSQRNYSCWGKKAGNTETKEGWGTSEPAADSSLPAGILKKLKVEVSFRKLPHYTMQIEIL